MWGVLDDDLLGGVVAAETHLRPARAARMLDAGDWAVAVTDVTRVCQLWGGVADLLVPVVGGAVPDPYPRLLRESELDGAVGDVSAVTWRHLPGELSQSAPALLALGTTERDRLKELKICDVRSGDPWELGYLAVLARAACGRDRSFGFLQLWDPAPGVTFQVSCHRGVTTSGVRVSAVPAARPRVRRCTAAAQSCMSCSAGSTSTGRGCGPTAALPR